MIFHTTGDAATQVKSHLADYNNCDILIIACRIGKSFDKALDGYHYTPISKYCATDDDNARAAKEILDRIKK